MSEFTVLITTDTLGGVWSYALDLAAGLEAAGVGATLAVLGPGPDAAQRQAVEARGLRLVETGLRLDWTDDEISVLDRTDGVLADLAAAEQVDLVHLNSPALAAAAGFAVPVVGGCHSDPATWWNTVHGGEPMPADLTAQADRVRLGFLSCAALIAPSRTYAAATAEQYRHLPKVVHNGRAGSPQPTARTQREPVAITAGRLWDAGKRVAVLDQAAMHMRHAVLAAGEIDPPKGDPIDFAHLALLGQLDAAALAGRFRQSALFVSVAVYEPFGLAVLEAAQAGCGLVLADIPTYRELWDEAAVFVPGKDAAALARTLDTLLDDPDECSRLGALAQARAARFTVEAMVAGTLAVYRDALDQRRVAA